ncbi:tetratricopeptide repeat protein, partial [Helicobacter ailurogastricus]|uniref:tetratricopeptide repeat protein n=1 Tax=Helicobacter ailurogastricus TaxID=1578720 RepID=UPI00249265C1
DLTPLKEELEDLNTKFTHLLDALATFSKALETAYNQSTEDDTELENALAQFKKCKVKTATHLNALINATESPQALENAKNLAKSLEDLANLLSALQESHAPLLQGTNTSHNPTQSTQTAQSTQSSNAPKVKPLWQYGANTLQAFKDYMQAKDLGSASAWLELGKMAYEGIVLYPDNNTAMRCFEKAIELGSVQAMVELGKVYMENGDVQVMEYGSGEVISGEEVISALNPLKDDLESKDYLTIFKHCQVFKDKTLTNCQEKAQELFEKAVGLGEGRGYVGLAEMFQYYKDDDEMAKTYYTQAMQSLKTQAQKGDGEAYALWGEALKEVSGYHGKQEAMQLFQKAIDLGYMDAYDHLAGLDYERADDYRKQGARLGSGKCAEFLHPSTDNLPYEGRDDLEDFKLAATQAVEFMDRLMECLKIQKFVALHCRHHRVFLRLLENLSLAKAINGHIGLHNVERYEALLELKIKEIADTLDRPNARFAKILGRNQWRFNALADYTNLRVFAKPYDSGYQIVNTEGEVEFDASLL